MKRLKYIIGLVSLSVAAGFTSCQDDFDDRKPDFEIPQATMTANTTILELKQAYWQDDLNYVSEVGTKENGDHYIVSGRIVSSDRAGNVYKKIIIDDGTAALPLSINYNSLYNEWRVGQEIVLDVTGMYFGKYCGCQQLGYPDVYEKTDVEQTSFMPYEFFLEHVEKNGLPEPEKVDTLLIRKFSDIPVSPTELPAFQSRLVRFNNVSFEEGGQSTFAVYKVNTNKILKDADGQTLTVRTSGYATFRDEVLPEGNGDVVALLDFYQTSADSDSSPWQLTIIDRNGVMNFGNPTMLPGDQDNPYTVAQVIELEATGESDHAWMTGYIVGAVAPEVTEVTSDSDIEWGSDVVLANTLVIGPDAGCKDYSKCVVISLPQDTPLRELGNLRDNPSNYGKQIWLYGVFEKYMGTWGITGNSGAASQFVIEGVDAPGAEFPDGDGTEASPLNCPQVIALNPTSTTSSPAGGEDVWVRGYIVGSMPTGGSSTTLSGTNFSTVDAAETNLVIGPTADCTDYTKCVSVQLSTTIRGALNLKANPGNLGKTLEIKGDVMKYCGGPGVKNGSEYKLSGDGGGDTPDPTPTPTPGSGTKDDPFDCSAVIALNPTSTSESPAGGAGVWVEGYIVGYMPSSGTYLNATVFSGTSDVKTNMVLGPTADCTDYNECISIQLPSGSLRNALNLAENPGNYKKKVKLFGDVMKYCGGPGLKNTSDYEFDGSSSGGDTPVEPTETEIYSSLSESLQSLPDGWTLENISMESGLDYVWSWKVYNNAGYLNASAYVSGSAKASEAYAISPVISLAGAKGCSVSFEHAAKFQTTLKDGCGICVRASGESSWTMLAMPVWPEAGSWTFVGSGDVDLSAYDGKDIQIAFKYVSTSAGADTWEVKNLVVKGNK